MNNETNEKSRVPALNRCLKLIGLISAYDALNVNDLASLSGIPKSSVYVLLSEMERQRLIRQKADGSYQLWVRVIELGQLASAKLDLREIVTDAMRPLLESIDCIALNFGIMDEDEGYYLIKLSNPHCSVSIRSKAGGKLSLVRDGIGKCLLAFQPLHVRMRLIPSLDYTKVTDTSITSAAKLKDELSKIRKQGWSLGNGENEFGGRSVSAPVWGTGSVLAGALSAQGLSTQFTDDRLEEYAERIKKCAKDLSIKLGWREKQPI